MSRKFKVPPHFQYFNPSSQFPIRSESPRPYICLTNSLKLKKTKFIAQAFKNMKSVGALAPSSKYLVKKMLEPIDFTQKVRILELGPGTGVITKEILERLNPNSELVSIELNEDFYEQLKCLESDNCAILKANAENVGTLFQDESFDYVISGLPLAIFKKELVSNILNGCLQVMKNSGTFIQFQYSLSNKRTLQRHFKNVNISLAAVNLPPAIIYTCQK